MGNLEQKVIVAIGAHPDDYEWGCGAALARHIAEGDRAIALIMTYGLVGKHPEDGSEAYKAAQILGISKEDVIIAPFPDGQIKAGEAAEFLQEYVPKGTGILYAPGAFDGHSDHINTAIAVRKAALAVPEIFLYQGPGNKSFVANHFIKINESDLGKKIRAYEAHKSQSIRPKDLEKKMPVYEAHWRQFAKGEELRQKMDSFKAQELETPFGSLFYGINEWAEFWGRKTGLGLAEAFETYKF